MSKHLHIICFTIPFPVAHGGIADLFYKIVALKNEGVHIHLHCFSEEGREAHELNEYCVAVHYYPRKKGICSLSFRTPYIVSSRNSKALVQRLLEDDYPILVEGIHSSGFLKYKRFRHRKLLLRLHNVEFLYYRQLFRNTNAIIPAIYYLMESILLKKYERKIVDRFHHILTVSEKDNRIYQEFFGAKQAGWLPVFTGHEEVNVPPGVGNYCLYHGNLSVAENNRAAFWLIEEVFNDLEIPLVIAGRNPGHELLKKSRSNPNVTVIANPGKEQLDELIRQAQCHVLPSFNTTGVKLKLINSLFVGRHCLVNPACVEESVLASLCVIVQDARHFKKLIQQYIVLPVDQKNIEQRQKVLTAVFDNRTHAKMIIRLLS